jgi:hypothetical protein
MPKTNSAPFPQNARMGSALCTVASTWSTAPTNDVPLGTIGENDGLLTKLEVIPLGTSTAMMLLLFAQLPGKAEKNLIAVKVAAAQSVSATATGWAPISFGMSELSTRRLPAGTKLSVAISAGHATGGMLFTGEWSDY